jgi:hypothetical protein
MGRRPAWSLAEIKRLTEAVKKQDPASSGLPINWVLVAEHVKSRSARKCRGKWDWQIGGASRKRMWLPEEDETLWEMRNSMELNTWFQIHLQLNRGSSEGVQG